nr:MAG TPA: hypothetical protein [Caudoviricetes sp.]
MSNLRLALSIAHCFCYILSSLSEASLSFLRVSDYIFAISLDLGVRHSWGELLLSLLTP